MKAFQQAIAWVISDAANLITRQCAMVLQKASLLAADEMKRMRTRQRRLKPVSFSVLAGTIGLGYLIRKLDAETRETLMGALPSFYATVFSIMAKRSWQNIYESFMIGGPRANDLEPHGPWPKLSKKTTDRKGHDRFGVDDGQMLKRIRRWARIAERRGQAFRRLAGVIEQAVSGAPSRDFAIANLESAVDMVRSKGGWSVRRLNALIAQLDKPVPRVGRSGGVPPRLHAKMGPLSLIGVIPRSQMGKGRWLLSISVVHRLKAERKWEQKLVWFHSGRRASERSGPQPPRPFTIFTTRDYEESTDLAAKVFLSVIAPKVRESVSRTKMGFNRFMQRLYVKLTQQGFRVERQISLAEKRILAIAERMRKVGKGPPGRPGAFEAGAKEILKAAYSFQAAVAQSEA